MKKFEQKTGIVGVRTLKTEAGVRQSAEHNYRDQDASVYPHVSLNATHQNHYLLGATNTAELLELLDKNLKKAKFVTKKSNICVEFLITADHYAFDHNGGSLNTEKFITDTKKILIEFFGEQNIIGLNVHLDELTPHIVAYIVPLVLKKEKTELKTIKNGTYPDGNSRYVQVWKTTSAYTSLSWSWYLIQFNGKSGIHDLFYKFLFEPNGLKRGFYFSRQKHIDAKQHKIALREGYSSALADLDISPKDLKSFGKLWLKSPEKICQLINSHVQENAKETIAMAAEYKAEKTKNLALEKTLTITQSKMKEINKEKAEIALKLEKLNSLNNENQAEIFSHIENLKNMELIEKQQKIDEEDAMQAREINKKEIMRANEIDKIKQTSAYEMLFLDDESRAKILRFCRQNDELEEKYHYLLDSEFFIADSGALTDKGTKLKNKNKHTRNNEESIEAEYSIKNSINDIGFDI